MKNDETRRGSLKARFKHAKVIVEKLSDWSVQLRGYSEFGFQMYLTSGTGTIDAAIEALQLRWADVADCHETNLESTKAIIMTYQKE